MSFRIDHTATHGRPVSFRRWAGYHLGRWLYRIGWRMRDRALYPDPYKHRLF